MIKVEKSKKRILTGVRTTHNPHIGNYLGAIKKALDFQDSYELFLFLADAHALNEQPDPKDLVKNSFEMAAAFLACGLNPKKSLMYLQSAVTEVFELAWILGCIAPYGLLQRGHSVKDAEARGLEINAGILTYPVLMAADILLYDGEIVPVGPDQKQHLEVARDLCQKFNYRYTQTLTVPEPLISQEIGIIPGVDGEKMSKSRGNFISLFAEDKVWKAQIAAIKTDSKTLEDPKDPESCLIYKIYAQLATVEEKNTMAESLRKGGYGYGHAKQDLLKKMVEVIGPMRDQYFKLCLHEQTYVLDVLNEGIKKARLIAKSKILEIREKVGFLNS